MAAGLILVLAALSGPASQASAVGFSSGGLVPETGHVVAFGSDFSVAKREFDGGPDLDFGRGGIARVGFPRFREARSYDAAVQLGARTVVAGYVTIRCRPSRHRSCGRRVALARFLASGLPDRSFGGDGKVVTPWGGRASSVIAADRRITLAGRGEHGLATIARLRFDGSPDRSFGKDGLVALRTTPNGGALEDGRIEEVRIQADGRILLSGYIYPAASPSQWGLVRLNRDGSIDRSFGDNGFVLNTVTLSSFPGYGSDVVGSGQNSDLDVVGHRFGFAPLPDGRILVSAAIDASGPADHVAVVRLLADGSPDLSYGVDGIARAPESVDLRFGTTLLATPDGGAYVGAAGFLHSHLLRFGPEGGPDPHYGAGGVAPQLESWGARASLSILGDGSVAVSDDRRETSGMLIGRYSRGGSLMWATTLP